MLRRSAVVGLLIATGMCWPLWATVLVPADLAELSRDAHVIARGLVTATETRWAGDDWRTIETVVTLATEGALKGAVGATVLFRIPGGQAGRYRRIVVGAPEFRVGQRVVVFLGDRGSDVAYTLGLSQGVFRLVQRSEGWMVTPPAVMPTSALPQAVQRGDGSRRVMPLGDFERVVRDLVRGTP